MIVKLMQIEGVNYILYSDFPVINICFNCILLWTWEFMCMSSIKSCHFYVNMYFIIIMSIAGVAL